MLPFLEMPRQNDNVKMSKIKNLSRIWVIQDTIAAVKITRVVLT